MKDTEDTSEDSKFMFVIPSEPNIAANPEKATRMQLRILKDIARSLRVLSKRQI